MLLVGGIIFIAIGCAGIALLILRYGGSATEVFLLSLASLAAFVIPGATMVTAARQGQSLDKLATQVKSAERTFLTDHGRFTTNRLDLIEVDPALTRNLGAGVFQASLSTDGHRVSVTLHASHSKRSFALSN